jgi:predicted transcriptional regulator
MNELDSIFYVLGNKTRRDILTTLTDEPMYFNQVAKEVRIGQQAISRHMQTLEDVGFVTTYGEKSDLGAPERKYYRINSSFNLSISLSEDTFTVNFNTQTKSAEKHKQVSRKFNSISKNPSNALDVLRMHLIEIDKEITSLQMKIDELQYMKQTILHKVHEIGKANFAQLERKILYKMMTNLPDSISHLSQMTNENRSDVRVALKELHVKMPKGKIKTLVNDLR